MEHEEHTYKDIVNDKIVVAWQVMMILQYRMDKWSLPAVFTPFWVTGELDLIDNTLYAGFGKRIPLERDNWLIITEEQILAVAGADHFRQNYIAWTIGPTEDLPALEAAVNHPAHYGGEDDDYEVIKVIEAWDLGFHLGNTVKYVARAGKKDPETLIQDLEKAKWYLDRKIANVKAGIDE